MIIIKKRGIWYYDINNLGYNYRLTEFQSALGISQLDKLEKFIKRRNEIAKIYDLAFQMEDNITIPKKVQIFVMHIIYTRLK